MVAAQEHNVSCSGLGRHGSRVLTPGTILQWLLIQRAKAEDYPIFENMGANNPDLAFFKSRFNPDLVMYFEIEKKDVLGAFSGWAYLTFVKKLLMSTGRV